MKGTVKIVLIAFIAGLAGAFTFQRFLSPEPVTEVIREVPAQIEQASYKSSVENISPNVAPNTPLNFREAAAKSVSSVVYIKNIQKQRRSMSMRELLFGRGGNYEGVAVGSGSGVIYSKDGYIITNNHVIEGASAIEVMHEKRTYSATLVGTDPKMDIAVLKIEAENLPAIELANSSDVEIGDWVLAVGNPFNLTSTVTAGIVSAIGSDANSVRENFPIELYIQTDAAINPGNSGGALVNTEGALVGINTSIISRTGSYAGYGFAVPSDIVVKIVEDLKNYRRVQKAYLGARTYEITEEIAQRERLKSLKGVFVDAVNRGGAADEAGLESGDVITTLNGKVLNSKASLDELTSAMSPGDVVTIGYERNRRSYETQLILENIRGNTDILNGQPVNGRDKNFHFSEFLGAELQSLNEDEKESLEVPYGVKITNLNESVGFMRKLDLKEGDIILRINRRWAAEPAATAKYIEEVTGTVYFEYIDSRGRYQTSRYRFN